MRRQVAVILLACAISVAAGLNGSILLGALAGGAVWLLLLCAVLPSTEGAGSIKCDARLLQQATLQWLLTLSLVCLPWWAYLQRPGVAWIVIGGFALSGWVFLLARSSLWRTVWQRARRGLQSAARRAQPDPSIARQMLALQGVGLLLVCLWCFPLPRALRDLEMPTFSLVAIVVVLLVATLIWQMRRMMEHGLSLATVSNSPALQDPTEGGDSQPGSGAVSEPGGLPLWEHWARAGHYQRVVDALQATPESLSRLREQDSLGLRKLLALACLHDDVVLLRHLILCGAELNPSGDDRRFPLLAAVRDTLSGRASIVAMLLANGADPKVTDAEGRTALHFAARYSELDVAAQLLDAGARLETPDREGKTPLYCACDFGNWRAAKYLLGRGAKTEWPGTEPALLGAASGEDDPAGVELLLRQKARVNAVGRFGRSALHEAALRGNVRVCASLLAAGAEPDGVDQAGATPLMEAIRSGVDGVVALFRQARVDVNRSDRYQRTPLILACTTPRTNTVTLASLLCMGARSDLRDEQGLSALDHALQRGRWDLVRCIDPDVDLPSVFADEQVRDASHVDLFERLRRAASANREDLLMPLLNEVPEQTAALCERLLVTEGLSLGAVLRDRLLGRLQADQRDQVLAHAMRRGDMSLTDALLRCGAQPSGRGLLADWLAQCANAPTDVVALQSLCMQMVDRGGDLHGTRSDALPLLHWVGLGWIDAVQAGLDRGCDPNVVDRTGFTPLMRAASQGDLPMVEALVRAGARVDLQCADGRTALGMALSAGRRELIEWLDWPRWPHPHRALRAADLISATRAGDVNAVRCLLACGFAVDHRDEKGSTALLHAAGSGELRIVQILLQADADVSLCATTGATAVSAAIMRGHREVVSALLSHADVVSQRFEGSVTALMLALALGRQEIATTLVSHGADPQDCDAAGNSALHYVARFGFAARDQEAVLRLWQWVLATSAVERILHVNQKGDSALMWLLGADAPLQAFASEACIAQQVALLIRHGASLEGQNSQGASVLHLAAQRGALNLVEHLLVLGAPRGLRDTIGRDASEVALSKGYVDVAAALRGNNAPVSMARLLRQPEN